MADFPALPLWTDAYIADTQHLTNEEHGVYLQLLMFAWRTPTCSLPDDDKRLAIMVGVTPRIWARLKPTVMAFWSLEKGQWKQKKLTRERKYVERMQEQKRAAGIASAKAKSLKSKETGSTAVPTAKPTERQQNANTHTHTHLDPPNPSGSPPPKVGKQKMATRLSSDWTLNESAICYARKSGLTEGEMKNEADRFRDYWIAKSGRDATKLDWNATWRNWIRNYKDRQGTRKPGGRGAMDEMVTGFERAALNYAAENR